LAEGIGRRGRLFPSFIIGQKLGRVWVGLPEEGGYLLKFF